MAFSNAIRNQVSYLTFHLRTLTVGQVRAENPAMAIKDISKEIGQRWRNLTAEEKAPFEEQFQKDRQR
jgi:hypothetical protein